MRRIVSNKISIKNEIKQKLTLMSMCLDSNYNSKKKVNGINTSELDHSNQYITIFDRNYPK